MKIGNGFEYSDFYFIPVTMYLFLSFQLKDFQKCGHLFHCLAFPTSEVLLESKCLYQGAFHSFKRWFEIFSKERDFYGFLDGFS